MVYVVVYVVVVECVYCVIIMVVLVEFVVVVIVVDEQYCVVLQVISYCLQLVWQLWQYFGVVIVGKGFFQVVFDVVYCIVEQDVSWLCVMDEVVFVIKFDGFFVDFVVLDQEVWGWQCVDYFVGEYYVFLVFFEWMVDLFYVYGQFGWQVLLQVLLLVFVQVGIWFEDGIV